MNGLEGVTSSRCARLAFGLENIDQLFPGFALGDFGVLYGLPACLSLSLLLCVRCQFPAEQGGLGSPAMFVDGGNTFDLYGASYIAQRFGLDPKSVLERIFVSRTFTAYQLASLILDKLEPAVEKLGSKLVVVSDASGLYLDRDVPKTEAMDVFNKLTIFLSKFAAEKEVVVVATNFARRSTQRAMFLESALLGRANVVVKVSDPYRVLRFTLEKHPTYRLGTAELPSEGVTLREFMEA